MLASAVLQTSVNAYRDAGLSEDSKRVRMLMEEKIGQSHDEMTSFETEIKISRDDMESFLRAVVVDDLGSTFVKMAAEFLPNRPHLEEMVRKSLEQSPLQAFMPRKIMADNHIAATVGSVEDDPFGRLLQQTTMGFGFEAIWLQTTLHRAIETHGLTIEHFVGWANRLALFDDMTFLIEGVRAWFEGDHVKAVHVLVPQMERGLRAIVAKLGKPVTKPHGTVAGVGVAIGMGDILYSEEVTQALGPDLTLYFLALYADPRGMNLRNRVAHGFINPEIDQRKSGQVAGPHTAGFWRLEGTGGAETMITKQQLLAEIRSELMAAQDHIIRLGHTSADERVATFLLNIAQRTGSDTPPVEIEVPFGRLDIADYLGLTVETVSREISKLKRDGLISMRGPHKIVSPAPRQTSRGGQDGLYPNKYSSPPSPTNGSRMLPRSS